MARILIVNCTKKKILSRFKTLLIPFILWCLIAITWQLKCFLPIISSYLRPVEIHLSLVRIFNTLFWNGNNNGIFVDTQLSNFTNDYYPIDAPLWYVRDLMVMALFSPFIFKLIKKIGFFLPLVLGMAWYLSPFFVTKANYISYLITSSFFFSIGATYGIRKIDIVVSFEKFKYAPIVYLPIAITDSLTKGMEYNWCLHKLGIIFGIISAVVVASYLIKLGKGKVCLALANTSFFIFALHSLIMDIIGKTFFTMLHLPDNNPYAMLLLYFLVPIINILICLGFYWFLKRNIPKICNLLTGGR